MNMEGNKILAAFLVAGIIAMLAGFIAKRVVHPEALEHPAYQVDVASAAPADGAASAPTGPEPITDLMASADPAQGEKLIKVCVACHTFDKGGANRIGPNLAGITGRAKASHDGFAYSDAMKAKGGTWSEADLNAFLWNPKAFVAGTKMNFMGFKKPEDRAAVIKYLGTLR